MLPARRSVPQLKALVQCNAIAQQVLLFYCLKLLTEHKAQLLGPFLDLLLEMGPDELAVEDAWLEAVSTISLQLPLNTQIVEVVLRKLFKPLNKKELTPVAAAFCRLVAPALGPDLTTQASSTRVVGYPRILWISPIFPSGCRIFGFGRGLMGRPCLGKLGRVAKRERMGENGRKWRGNGDSSQVHGRNCMTNLYKWQKNGGKRGGGCKGRNTGGKCPRDTPGPLPCSLFLRTPHRGLRIRVIQCLADLCQPRADRWPSLRPTRESLCGNGRDYQQECALASLNVNRLSTVCQLRVGSTRVSQGDARV